MNNGDILFFLAYGAVEKFSPSEVETVFLGPTDRSAGLLDRLVLMNGTEFTGWIMNKRKDDGRVYLQLSTGDVLPLRTMEIRLVERGVAEAPADWEEAAPFEPPSPETDHGALPDPAAGAAMSRKKPEYQFRERGWYVAGYFAGLNGRTDGGYQLGLGLHGVLGFQFSRWLGAGGGLGLDGYSFEDSEYVLPVFAEIRGYFLRRQVTPYYHLMAGYGFPLAGADQNIVRVEGSPLLHPSLGMRFGADSKVNVVFEFGYRFQSATFFREFEDSGIKEREAVDYRRVTLRFGLLF